MTPVENFQKRIKACSYPGRGIVLGFSETGKELVQVYWIMGRSENSQNRVFEIEDGILRTKAADPKKMQDPSLVIYEAMKEIGKHYIVTNGDQTETVFQALKNGRSFESAIFEREREPDSPNYTPRISGLVTIGSECQFLLSIIKANRHEAAKSDRFFYNISDIEKGNGYCLTTYMSDGNPIPSFEGEPFQVPLKGSAEDILNEYWNGLNEENRISVAVKMIGLDSGSSKILIHNRHDIKG